MQRGLYILWHQAGRIQTSTYFVALHTEDSRDPLWSKWHSTQQAVWVSVTARFLLNIIQVTGKTPENKKFEHRHRVGTGFLNQKSSKSMSICVWLTDVIYCNRDNSFPSHSILSCSMFSIVAARASTLLIISFSSSVRSFPGGPPDTLIVHLIWNPKHTHK